MSLGRLSIDLEANIARFTSDMGRAAQIAEKNSRDIRASVSTIGKAVLGAGAAVAAGVAGIVVSTANAADKMRDLSQQTGISTEVLSGYAYAATQSGTSLEQLTSGIRRMQRSLTDAASGTAEQAQAFERLGLSAAELVRMSPDKAFELVAERLSQMENATIKAATAQQIFGRGGTALLPIMADGAAGIQAMTSRVEELGAVISQDFANNADQFNDNLGDMKLLAQGAAISFTEALIPGLIGYQEYLIKAATGTNDFAEAGEFVIDVIKRMVQAFVALKGILSAVGTVLVGIVAAFGGGLKAIGGALLAMNTALANSLAALGKGDFAGSAAALADMPKQIAAAWNTGAQEMATALAFIPDNLKQIKDDTDRTLADLEKAFSGARKPADDLGDTVADTAGDFELLGKAADKTAETIKRYEYQIKQLLSRSEAANKVIDEGVRYIEEQEEAYRQLVDAGKDLIDRLYPMEAATRGFHQELAILTGLYERGALNAQQFADAQLRLANDFAETTRQVAGQEEAVDQWATMVEEGARILERAFQGMWENLLSGADNVFDEILEGFKSLIAQMIHQATTQSIILNIQQGLSGKGFNWKQLGADVAQLAGVILGSALGGGGEAAAMGSSLGSIIGEKLGEKFLTTVLGGLGVLAGPLGSIIGALLGGALGGMFDRSLQFALGGANIGHAGDAQRITTPLGQVFGISGRGGAGSLNDPSTPLGEIAGAIRQFDTEIAKALTDVVDDDTFRAITESLKGWTGSWGENASAADVLQSRFAVILSNFTGDIQAFVRGAEDFEGQLDRFGVALAAEKLIADNQDIFAGRTTGELLNLVGAFRSGAETMTEAFNEFLEVANRVIAVHSSLRDFADSDLLADLNALLSETSLADALAGVNQALLEAIANFDGSIESLEEIGALSMLVREGELKLLSQIDAIQKGLNANLDQLRADILGLNAPALSGAQIFSQAQDLIGQLDTARTAQDVAALERQFTGLIQSMTPDDQAFMQNEIVGLIELFRAQANEVINAQRQDVLDNATSMRDAVDLFIAEIGDPLTIIAASLEGRNIPEVIEEGIDQIDATVATIGPQVAQALQDGLSNVQITVVVQDAALANQ